MINISDNNLLKSASYLSVLIAMIICFAKIYGWLITDSQSMLASLIDSLLDISSSLINLIAIRVSIVPPDDNHRFGHEKFEDLAVFSQSMFFSASGLFIFFSSLKSLIFGDQPANVEVGNNVMFFCIILTFLLVIYQSYVFHRTKSAVIAADKLHYLSDFFANIAVVISLHLSDKYWFIDSIAGILIAIYILHGSYKLFYQSIKNLSDEEFPQSDKDKVLSIVGTFQEVKGIHELKTRYASNKPFIQFHLELDANLSLKLAHEIADKVEDAIKEQFPLAEVIIHQDPEGVEQNVNYREKI